MNLLPFFKAVDLFLVSKKVCQFDVHAEFALTWPFKLWSRSWLGTTWRKKDTLRFFCVGGWNGRGRKTFHTYKKLFFTLAFKSAMMT